MPPPFLFWFWGHTQWCWAWEPQHGKPLFKSVSLSLHHLDLSRHFCPGYHVMSLQVNSPLASLWAFRPMFSNVFYIPVWTVWTSLTECFMTILSHPHSRVKPGVFDEHAIVRPAKWRSGHGLSPVLLPSVLFETTWSIHLTPSTQRELFFPPYLFEIILMPSPSVLFFLCGASLIAIKK